MAANRTGFAELSQLKIPQSQTQMPREVRKEAGGEVEINTHVRLSVLRLVL